MPLNQRRKQSLFTIKKKNLNKGKRSVCLKYQFSHFHQSVSTLSKVLWGTWTWELKTTWALEVFTKPDGKHMYFILTLSPMINYKCAPHLLYQWEIQRINKAIKLVATSNFSSALGLHLAQMMRPMVPQVGSQANTSATLLCQFPEAFGYYFFSLWGIANWQQMSCQLNCLRDSPVSLGHALCS